MWGRKEPPPMALKCHFETLNCSESHLKHLEYLKERFLQPHQDNVCEAECVRARVRVCASASANQSSSLCTKIQMWRAQSFCCLWRLFTHVVSNEIMLVLWLLPFKHRCEEPLVHFFFFRNLLLMINKIYRTATQSVWRIRCHTNAICAPLHLSLPCISDNVLKERRSVKGGRDEPFRPWKKDLVTGHVAERTLHGFCSGFHRPAYFGETRK